MPPASKRPSPPARMVSLLAAEKRRLLAEKGHVTRQDFDEAWDRATATLKAEHAYPHATEQRRAWKAAIEFAWSEVRAAFLDRPTAVGFVTDKMTALVAARLTADAEACGEDVADPEVQARIAAEARQTLPPAEMGKAMLLWEAYLDERGGLQADVVGLMEVNYDLEALTA